VTRFPALLTTGMHGTEHREQKHRAHRLSAPRPPFSPAAGSIPRSAPQFLFCSGPVARIGLSLSCNGPRSHASHSRVSAPRPDTSRPYQLLPRPVRLSAPLPIPVRPEIDGIHALARCRFLNRHGRPLPCLHSPSGLLPPSGSKRSTDPLPASPPSGSARSPFAPHSRFLSLVFRLRIIVRGPLRFRRLAVPQTSWNHLHYAPEAFPGQSFLYRSAPFFLNLFLLCFM
jgi:hypothetical protein